MKDFDKAVELKPNYAMPHYHHGELFLTLKNFPAAIEDLNAAIGKNKFFFEARRLRGIALYLLRKFHRALEDFNDILKINVKSLRL